MNEPPTRRGEDSKVVPSPQYENKRREWIYIFEGKLDLVGRHGRGGHNFLLLLLFSSFEVRRRRALPRA